jgi:mono/diheme cytochrome c family protein
MRLKRAFILCLPALAAVSVAPGQGTRFVDPDSAEVAALRAAGEQAVVRLASTLTGEVADAVARGGPENAVEVCHLKAVPLTAGVATALPGIREVKRTSLKLRNPANAPDAAEQAVLDRLAALVAGGKPLPPVLVQRHEPAGAPAEWRVYKPIVLQPHCVVCHGDPGLQSPALRARLADRYPGDQATGYRAGDWRGIFRVTVEAAP